MGSKKAPEKKNQARLRIQIFSPNHQVILEEDGITQSDDESDVAFLGRASVMLEALRHRNQ